MVLLQSAGLNTGNYTFDYRYDSVKASATGVWSVQYFDGSIEYDGEVLLVLVRPTQKGEMLADTCCRIFGN